MMWARMLWSPEKGEDCFRAASACAVLRFLMQNKTKKTILEVPFPVTHYSSLRLLYRENDDDGIKFFWVAVVRESMSTRDSD